MRERPWLLLDCNNLCWRSFYAMKELEHGALKTGMLFGFMREISALQMRFQTTRIAFFFDLGKSFRCNLFKGYKAKRGEGDEEKLAARAVVQEQIRDLRVHWLPMLGFKNVFAHDGYEADDLIAQTAADLYRKEKAVIVSGDTDLYQCVRRGVFLWRPKEQELVTRRSFKKKYGIKPRQWVDLKAMTGCSTDDVPGIKGVGEKTALKILLGGYNKKSIADFNDEDLKLIGRNRSLVSLPWAGAPRFKTRPDEATAKKWRRVCKKLGIRSLQPPLSVLEHEQ